MSNYLAIGGVSSTLRTLLLDRMEVPPGETLAVSIDTPTEDEDTAETRVNLFLYYVNENGSLKNQEIPGHGHPGRYGRPPLSLDLYYLVTAYGSTTDGLGNTDETMAQYLLGSAMRVFHDYPLLTDSLETATSVPVLDPSLLGQFERIKISLTPLSLEDVTKVWTALTLPFRLSVAYQVNVVQIESQAPRLYPKPVGELPDAGPRLKVITMTTPHINQLLVKRQGTPPADPPSPLPYARIGDTLVINGSGFLQDETAVQIEGVSVTPASLTPLQVQAAIPDDGALQPGPRPLKVVRQVLLGTPPELRSGFQSNLCVFMLVPRLDTVSLAAGTVTINGARLFQENKPCHTIIGDAVVESAAYTTTNEDEIEFALPALPAGVYAVRVRVNGAESIDAATLTVP